MDEKAIVIIISYHYKYVKFENEYWASVYRNPSMSSWGRVIRAINKHCRVEVVQDDWSYYIVAKRNHCPTCGDGDIENEPQIDIPECVLEEGENHG